MKHYLLFGIVSAFMMIQAVPVWADSPDAFEFFAEEAKVVVTASKSEMNIAQAPSVVTVITQDEIQRQGLRSISEALGRTVGFFQSRQVAWPVTAERGLIADSNSHYLLLIDGHAQNSIDAWGPYQQMDLPLMDKVDHIEVVRGPGSTLWGSDAALGVINVITKKGSDINGLKASYDYSTGDNQRAANVTYGKALTNGDALLSVTQFSSNGYGTGHDQMDYHFSWADPYARPNAEMWDPSWEIYGKMHSDNLTLTGRALSFSDLAPWGSTANGSTLEDENWKQFNLEAKHEKELTANTTLESRIFSDSILFERMPTVGTGASEEETEKEFGYGAEFMTTTHFGLSDDLKVGTRGVRTEVGPNPYPSTVPATNTTVASPFFLGTATGDDDTLAVYTENLWRIADRTTVTTGVRFDHNDFRDKNGEIDPRVALTQGLNDQWTAKYMFNTGYIRPSVFQSMTHELWMTPQDVQVPLSNATRSERILSNDWQMLYQGRHTSASLTFFYLTVQNYISWVDNATSQGYQNISDAVSRGVELEFRHQLTRRMALYGNYSYARATLNSDQFVGSVTNPDRVFLGVPHHIYNVGTDFSITEKITFNLHLQGWREMPYAGTAGDYPTLAGSNYLDANLAWEDVARLPLSLSIYANNALDDNGAIGNGINGGWFSAPKTSVGVKVAYKL